MAIPQQQPRASLNHWMRSMQTHMDDQRRRLAGRDPLVIAHSSGAAWQPSGMTSGMLSMRFFGEGLYVQVPGFAVVSAAGQPVSPVIEALVIAYLLQADGAPRAGEWIGFRDLPNGLFYHRAFDSYTGQRLARDFGADLDAFKRGAAAVSGSPLTALGDAAYEFRVLPRLWMAAVYWLGDDEDGFPPQARVLFDRAAEHYMICDGLAIIGSQLTRHVIAAAEV